eukprot:6181737-Alexandrium_andersonii.AAC.1
MRRRADVERYGRGLRQAPPKMFTFPGVFSALPVVPRNAPPLERAREVTGQQRAGANHEVVLVS